MPPGTRSSALALMSFWSGGGVAPDLLGAALLDLLPFLAVFCIGKRKWAVLTGPDCTDDHWQRVTGVIPEDAVLESDGAWTDELDYMIFTQEEPVD